MGKSDFVSVEEAGLLLGVQSRQVRNLIKAGLLAAQRVGGAYIIARADVAKVPSVRKPGPKGKTAGKGK